MRVNVASGGELARDGPQPLEPANWLSLVASDRAEAMEAGVSMPLRMADVTTSADHA